MKSIIALILDHYNVSPILSLFYFIFGKHKHSKMISILEFNVIKLLLLVVIIPLLVVFCSAVFIAYKDQLNLQTLHRNGAWKVCKNTEEDLYLLYYGKEVRSTSSDMGVIFEAYKHVTTEARNQTTTQLT